MVRSTSKAIIINNGKILLNKCYDKNNGYYYSLPGGGQQQFETMEQAVVRECLEETGYKVEPISFGAICEEICDNPNCTSQNPHKMFHIFICKLISDKKIKPTETDKMQIGSEWVDTNNFHSINILPKAVGQNIEKIINKKCDIFLGSEHIKYTHG